MNAGVVIFCGAMLLFMLALQLPRPDVGPEPEPWLADHEVDREEARAIRETRWSAGV